MSNLSFNGVYRVDANQPLASREKCRHRNVWVGYFASHSANKDEITKKFFDFQSQLSHGTIPQSSQCQLTFDIKEEKMCKAFEKYMTDVGQKFERIG